MYRAYSRLTDEFVGPPRQELAAAEGDATRYERAIERQGGMSQVVIARPDPDADGRSVDLDGYAIWPQHGRSCGSVRW